MEEAATTIQATWRGNQARAKLQEEAEEAERMEGAATTIQAAWRGKQGREQLKSRALAEFETTPDKGYDGDDDEKPMAGTGFRRSMRTPSELAFFESSSGLASYMYESAMRLGLINFLSRVEFKNAMAKGAGSKPVSEPTEIVVGSFLGGALGMFVGRTVGSAVGIGVDSALSFVLNAIVSTCVTAAVILNAIASSSKQLGDAFTFLGNIGGNIPSTPK